MNNKNRVLGAANMIILILVIHMTSSILFAAGENKPIGFDGAQWIWHGSSDTKYAELAKTSPDSALRDINDLVARAIFIQNSGGGRSTSYRLVAAEELC